MDSSPDLSLKLRRGSSDSRDSFYMDFAQGIDSDIEEVETVAAGARSEPSKQQGQLQQPKLPVDQQLLDSPSDGASPSPIHVPPPMALLPATSSGGRITPSDVLPPPLSLSLPLELQPMRLPSDCDVSNIRLPPSPSSPDKILISSETLSHHSSPARSGKLKNRPQHVTILNETTTIRDIIRPSSTFRTLSVTPPDSPLTTTSLSRFEANSSVGRATGGLKISSSQQQLLATTALSTTTPSSIVSPESSSGQLAIMYHATSSTTTTTMAQQHHQHHHHHHLHPIMPVVRQPSRSDTTYTKASGCPVRQPEIRAGDALATTFSALYGKLLVVMGIAFPMAEVISTYIPPSFYEVFYLYLYIGSMMFLFFMYATLIWGRPKVPKLTKMPKSTDAAAQRSCKINSASATDLESINESDTESHTSSECQRNRAQLRRPSILAAMAGGGRGHYGSFYLRMGAVAFGIGSMIYSGLEFGQYFELERDTKCHNVLLALTPATRMAFIFIQMYFIFLNNEQMKVYRHKIIARFGLMHMIGTNLSVWLNVLIQETKHEILTFYDPENRTLRISHRLGNKLAQHAIETETAHLRVARGLKGPHHIFECRRTNIIGTLVQDASPFLFPCTIEYSLICAAILYVMWRGICRPATPQQPPAAMRVNDCSSSHHSPCKRSPHHYSVDCAQAHKGLFVGILILVLTIISLILFFVLISRPEFVSLAVTEVTICELTIYATATVATLIGMVQVRHMRYDAYRSFQLDDILLVGAQTGLFLYSTFTVIGGHFTLRRDTVLVLITALASIVQTACQTMFILDASRRNAATPDHIRRKPGREIVTFLLVANLAMWAISTLEKSRAESHPIQLNFYGLWAWTIITHVSMPLAIFYRFHSTVCLCEIWKRAYKMRPSYC